MKHIKPIIISLIIIYFSQLSFGENFDIQAMKIGPNPLIQGTSELIVNYTATTYHTAEYYFYSVTGELIFYKKIEPSISENACSNTFTTSGTCKFSLASTSTMASIPKQVYVLAALFTSTYGNSIGDQISKKKYVVVK